MWPSNFDHCWNYLSGNKKTSSSLVPCYVVDDVPEDRSKRKEFATYYEHTMGFRRYETAWTWLHKLRYAMIRPGRDRLKGTVEVDETFIGGTEEDVSGRKIATKTLVVIAVEVEDKKLGRIRFRIIPDASAASLIPFIRENVTFGSIVITDAWIGYAPLKKENYEHVVENISKSEKKASEMLPHIHGVVSLIKRWLLGTHQGAVSPKHLAGYLDEYAQCRFLKNKSS